MNIWRHPVPDLGLGCRAVLDIRREQYARIQSASLDLGNSYYTNGGGASL